MQPRNTPYTMNPDMVAFTIGRVSLHLMRTFGQVSAEGINDTLRKILKTGPRAGVTPEMAASALRLLLSESEPKLFAAA